MNLKLIKEIKMDSVINKNESIDDTDLDGEKVMMNLDKGQYFMMNEVGSRIWDIIEKPMTPKEIVQALLNEYEVEEATCEETVMEFLNELNKAELVQVK